MSLEILLQYFTVAHVLGIYFKILSEHKPVNIVLLLVNYI